MDIFHDPAFWWALTASIWAVLSDYLGANPSIQANGVSQLLIRVISTIITGETEHNRRNRRNRR